MVSLSFLIFSASLLSIFTRNSIYILLALPASLFVSILAIAHVQHSRSAELSRYVLDLKKSYDLKPRILHVFGKPIYFLWDYEMVTTADLDPEGITYLFCSWYLLTRPMKIQKMRVLQRVLPHLVICANTQEETDLCTRLGFECIFVPHNAFVDPTVFIPTHIPKKYDLVVNSRYLRWKRVYLAELVPNTVSIGFSESYEAGWERYVPRFATALNFPEGAIRSKSTYHKLTSREVALVLNQSKVGGIFSVEEGGCSASMEYLLSGLPVVSTPSKGGRDVFFTAANSLIVGPKKKLIREGVKMLIEKNCDPDLIREDALKQMDIFLTTFAQDVALRIQKAGYAVPSLDEIKKKVTGIATSM